MSPMCKRKHSSLTSAKTKWSTCVRLCTIITHNSLQNSPGKDKVEEEILRRMSIFS